MFGLWYSNLLSYALAPPCLSLYRYFSRRFPGLLLSVFFFALHRLADDHVLAQYWPCGAPANNPFFAAFKKLHSPKLKPGALQPWPAADVDHASFSSATSTSLPDSGRPEPGGGGEAALASTSTTLPAIPEASSPTSPMAGGEGGRSMQATAGSSAVAGAPQVVVGYEVADEGEPLDFHVKGFPRREGKQLCDFFVKTGFCKFGDTCVFDHPDEYSCKFTPTNLPLRPQEPVCSFYLKHAVCKFGPACRFHHPRLKPIFSGSVNQL